MSDSIVLQLQRLSLDDSANVSDLLRKAYFAARKLNISDIRDFLSKEINGYNEADIIPPFRIMKGNLIAYDGKKEIELNLTRSHTSEFYFCRHAMLTLEEVYKQHTNNDIIYIKVSDEKILRDIKEQIRQRDNRMYLNFGLSNEILHDELFETMRPDYTVLLKINKLQYNQIFNIMRSFVSEWSIQLEEQGYIDNNFQFTKEIEMSVNNNYNINTVNGIIGNISNSTVNQSNTSTFKGNDNLLRESLQQKSVPQEDIDEISKILKQSEPPKNKDNLPPEVDGWLNKMVGKALNGSWEISVATAGSVLSQILCLYFGIM